MWPFNHKTNCGKTSEENAWFRQRGIEDDAIATLREWRDVGQTFSYLGRTMCVVRHCHPGPYGLTRVPAITATYVDESGILREHVFDWAQCAAMIQEQPNPRNQGPRSVSADTNCYTASNTRRECDQ